ncbi:MAG TPA: TetR/AcrR family transcriptional regulator [Euzebyales bacterium]|nr:TetR/AcrR family transcriptional regulator [Euzebyales bacterium]
MTTTDGTATRRSRARRGEGERLREDILRAAERLLLETGDADAVSIRAVADAVGVTPPSIYLHFTDKTELIFQVCQEQWQRFDDYLKAAVGGIDDPVEWLETAGHAYIEWGRDNPELYRILFMSKPRETPPNVDKQAVITSGVFGDVLAVTARAIEAGQLVGDPAVVAPSVWAAAHGVTSLLISVPDMPWPDVEQLTGYVLDRALQRPASA